MQDKPDFDTARDLALFRKIVTWAHKSDYQKGYEAGFIDGFREGAMWAGATPYKEGK